MAEIVMEAVVSFGVEKLWELLSREAERLQGVHEQVADLKRQMRTLQSLLKDAEAKKYKSERVRNFLEDVKDIVYDAEDIIESFILNKRQEKGILSCFLGILSCFLEIYDRRKFVTDIECITKRISEVIVEMQSFGIQQIIDSGRSLSLQERQRVQREIRQTFPNSSESDLVGVEHSVEELADHLVKNDNIQVVSISGMGGIGKTTLARQVFKHDIVRRHFDGFAWVCVSQEFTQKDIWQRILQDLRPHDEDIKKMEARTLQDKLFQMLKTSRYLIVLDDVWKNEDWDRISYVFSKKGGGKMLLTSRNEDVGFHANPTCFAFKPRVLTPEESWKLCESIVFPRRGKAEFRVDEELKAMGRKMATCCGGLPLAVKVLGGLLAKKHTISEWKKVYENIGTKIIGRSGLDDNNLNSVYRVLSVSYEDLSMQLKHCFLYLAHFPEDYKIDLNKLFHYWASERIITSVSNGATIRESGEDYLEELVRRNMVIVHKASLGLTLENCGYCQMHDMMREVCLSKAKEENFLQVIKVSASTSTISDDTTTTRSRRLAVHSGNALDMLRHKNNKKIRSVLYLGVGENLWNQPAPGLQNLPLLRVLDLDNVEFEGGKLPSSIGELIHLRFLSLRDTNVSHIPSSLRNLKLLLYLDLFQPRVKVHVPNILKEMLELRFLMLPLFMDDKTKLELGDLVNLEKLGFFSTKHSSVTDLQLMTRLTDLAVNFNGGCTSETLWSSLRGLRHLHSFALVDIEESQKDLDFYEGDFALDLIHITELRLIMHLPRFPDLFQFPPHLARIVLMNCRMEEDPMPILEKLLHLRSVDLLGSAFVGKRMVCSKGGFSQLNTLQIWNLEELEEWIVEEGSMPCLRTMIIIGCKKLKELPDGLKYITSLKELKIVAMKNKLVPDGENEYKFQHIPDIQFIDCD